MKKLFLLLIVSGFTVSHAQTVREENRGMIGKITATWCPPCGDWGWRLADQYIDTYKDNAFYVGIFSSPRTDGGNAKFKDSLTAAAWANMFGMNGYPSFSINGVDKSAQNSSQQGVNTAGITRDIASAMDAYMSSPVIAGTGYWYEKEGTEITVQIKTKFFQDVTGDYYVAAYLVEDGAMNIQASKGSAPVAHHNVLRGSMSRDGDITTYWGDRIVSGSASAGDEFETSYTIDVETQTLSQSQGWDFDKLKVITIIWKRNSMGRYEYVNGNDQNQAPIPASVADMAKAKANGMSGLAVYPNPVSGNATLSVMMERAADVQIRVMDVSGSVVYMDNTRFNSGMNTWNVETSGLASGTYMLSVSTGKGTLTQRLSVVK